MMGIRNWEMDVHTRIVRSRSVTTVKEDHLMQLTSAQPLAEMKS